MYIFPVWVIYTKKIGEPLWLSGKVVKNEKINDIKRTKVRSPQYPGQPLKKYLPRKIWQPWFKARH
jgi:hypothetical protein